MSYATDSMRRELGIVPRPPSDDELRVMGYWDVTLQTARTWLRPGHRMNGSCAWLLKQEWSNVYVSLPRRK